MKVYKYDPETKQIVVEDSRGNATLHIPIAGTYEYEHGEKEVSRVPNAEQTPTWNFNNPLKNWNFPILNKLKDLVTQKFGGVSTDTSSALDLALQQNQLSEDDERMAEVAANLQLSPTIQGTPSSPTAQPAVLEGLQDFNNDGTVNVLDAIFQQKEAALPPTAQQWDTSSDFPLINEPIYNREPFDMNQGLSQILEAIQGVPDLPNIPSMEGESVETEAPSINFGSIVPGEYYEVDEGQGMTKYDWGTGPYASEFEKSSKEEFPTTDPKEDDVVESTDYGLFQINDYWHDEEAQDTIWNQYIHPKDMSSMEQVSYAKSLYDKEGWDVWAAYDNGSYKKYLDWTDDDYKDKGVSSHDLRRIDLFFNNPDGSGSLKEARIAKAIMFAESGGKRDAKNINKKKG